MRSPSQKAADSKYYENHKDKIVERSKAIRVKSELYDRISNHADSLGLSRPEFLTKLLDIYENS